MNVSPGSKDTGKIWIPGQAKMIPVEIQRID